MARRVIGGPRRRRHEAGARDGLARGVAVGPSPAAEHVTLPRMGRITEHVSAVTVSEPVSGAVARRERGPDRSPRSSRVRAARVDSVLLATAQRLVRPGQRLVVVSPTELRIVNA